jgi:hypothetical protein
MGGIHCSDHTTPLYPQKLALNFADKWQSSVSIVRLRTRGHGVFCFCFLFVTLFYKHSMNLLPHNALNGTVLLLATKVLYELYFSKSSVYTWWIKHCISGSCNKNEEVWSFLWMIHTCMLNVTYPSLTTSPWDHIYTQDSNAYITFHDQV